MAGDGQQLGLCRHGSAIARMRNDLGVRIELAECCFDQRQSGDRAGLAGNHDRSRARIFRHRRDRGDVARPAEILGQRSDHRVVDFELREKRVRAEQGRFRLLLAAARKVDDAIEHVLSPVNS
jgi:hypothetical protein